MHLNPFPTPFQPIGQNYVVICVVVAIHMFICIQKKTCPPWTLLVQGGRDLAHDAPLGRARPRPDRFEPWQVHACLLLLLFMLLLLFLCGSKVACYFNKLFATLEPVNFYGTKLAFLFKLTICKFSAN